ncbi:hypothetical protein DBB36_01980 [Flavobacterium sp. WLB]|uniref:hypothetical protein n=1 Tax=unclassified Flavobacterium TaxID=196869 RepID=UPI0006ABA2A7|nr:MULTISPECIES: hypothetical protein [unclassified Flavobacterium]KOP35839.1 hypothetical protein AKO67_23205 [Flavobacterium sp. VMW]OWU89550.1 hypothetical protein APR43_17400 [Flavobacterium sp. NLM]PUU71784.1 hypothetical protein DBB36_01980 [Flavobacterium sp. WLB]
MNIIELIENAGIYKENRSAFSTEDSEKVRKQFEIERSQNPNLDPNLADNLITAFNEFPKEILFISNNRILYNFFARKNYSRNRFITDYSVSVNEENIKSFIGRFLSKDLDTFFDQNIAQNRFDDLLNVKEYLPQNSLDNLSQKISTKLDFVVNKFDENPSLSSGAETIEFIKYRSFYTLLSHFRSAENDKKIRAIYSKMSGSIVSAGVRNEFLEPMVSSMVNYKPIDYELSNTIRSHKDRIDAAKDREYSSSSSSGGMSTWSIVVLRLILLLARLGRA